jgi:hypothetical protein
MKYVTMLSNFDNRVERESVALKAPYKVNTLPYKYAQERYEDVLATLGQLAHDLDSADLQDHLEQLVGEKAKGYCMGVLYHNRAYSQHPDKINRMYLAEQCYNKVVYWNIFNNTSRLFMAIVDVDELYYETSKSINVNKYFNSQVENFIKTLMGTEAVLVIKDSSGHKLGAYTFHEADHSWDYKNEYWNEIARDLIVDATQCVLSEEVVHPVVKERYMDLMSVYSNLELSPRVDLVDYSTRFYFNDSTTVRDVDLITFAFLKENNMLEEKLDVDEIKAELVSLKEQIRKVYPIDEQAGLELCEQYIELDAKLSREFALDNELGFNDTLAADEDEDVENTVINHLDNQAVETYVKLHGKTVAQYR